MVSYHVGEREGGGVSYIVISRANSIGIRCYPLAESYVIVPVSVQSLATKAIGPATVYRTEAAPSFLHKVFNGSSKEEVERILHSLPLDLILEDSEK